MLPPTVKGEFIMRKHFGVYHVRGAVSNKPVKDDGTLESINVVVTGWRDDVEKLVEAANKGVDVNIPWAKISLHVVEEWKKRRE